MTKNSTDSTVAAQLNTTKMKPAKKKVSPGKSATRKTTVKATPARKKIAGRKKITAEEKRVMIALHAYYKWEQAGRPDNSETHHWFEAEQEIENILG